MVLVFSKYILLLLLLLLLSQAPVSANAADWSSYKTIVHYYQIENIAQTRTHAFRFLRKFKQSRYVPDVRLIIAQTETDPAKAVKKYALILKYYTYYKKNDFILKNICDLYSLQGNWKELLSYSRKAITAHKHSEYFYSFQNYEIIALMKLGKFQQAKTLCLRLLDENHDYNNLADTLLKLSVILKNTTGFSRLYIYKLRELVLGFYESRNIPSILLLLGEFYDKHKEYNKAYTAYKDILRYFPFSPESLIARSGIDKLLKFKPRREAYIPGKKIINTFDNIYLDNHIISVNNNQKVYYSLYIGPFNSQNRVNSIKKLIKDFDSIKTAYVKEKYFLYIGSYQNSASAFKMKIRLAEEYGINATVVRVSNKHGKSYIYRE